MTRRGTRFVAKVALRTTRQFPVSRKRDSPRVAFLMDDSVSVGVDTDLSPLPQSPQPPFPQVSQLPFQSSQSPALGGDSAFRMLRYVRELDTYIDNNARFIVNYGERYRNGERISTGFVESTINQVVSKRMVKKQQMQWTPKGAHLRPRSRNGKNRDLPYFR